LSRSRRKPAYYQCSGENPRAGKVFTSRLLRRKVRQRLKVEGEEFDFAHLQDVVRGTAGSRMMDWGCEYFGDGRVNPYQALAWRESSVNGSLNIWPGHYDGYYDEWMEKLRRK